MIKSFFEKFKRIFNNDNIITNLSNSQFDITEYEKDLLNKKIKNNYKLQLILTASVFIFSLLLGIFFNKKIILGGILCSVFIITYFISEFLKYIDEKDLMYVKCKCKKRKRKGYRFQYFDFTFEYKKDDGDDGVFHVLATQKNFFREDNEYIFLINYKDLDSLSDIERKNVLCFIKI